MTINEAFKNGIEVACEVTKSHRFGEIEVQFYNTQDETSDATSFDVKCPITNEGAAELHKLYKEFCKENGIKTNTVEALVLLHVADSMEELEKIC